MRRFRREPEQVHLVTDAAPSRRQEIDARMRSYLIKMAIRTACFILAIVIPGPLVLRLALIGAALLLPWMSVVVANAPGLPPPGRPRPVIPQTPPALQPGAEGTPPPAAPH